jgi:hypothetical protein
MKAKGLDRGLTLLKCVFKWSSCSSSIIISIPLTQICSPQFTSILYFVTLSPLDIVVMRLETRSRGELTRNFPAAWPGNTQRRPHSKAGWTTLESRDTAKDPSSRAAMLGQRWDDRVILKGDISKSVCWRAKDGKVTEGILCMRKLRSDKSTPVNNVFENPSRRNSFLVWISNIGGFGKARIGPSTTFVTNQGRFVVSVEQRTVRPPLLEPSIAALYTSATYIASFEEGSMQCMRARDYFPPVSLILLSPTIP